MTITIYELLGLVKDGKAPKHIKYRDEEWWWGYDTYTYFADLERTPDAQTNMFTRYVINYCLDDDVEILEEENKIEKLDEYAHIDSLDYNMCNIMFERITNKINELIDKINKLKEK